MLRTNTNGFGPAMGALLGLLLLGSMHGVEAGRLHIAAPDQLRHPLLSYDVSGDRVVAIEVSRDLRSWIEIGRGHGSLEQYPDLTAQSQPGRFYRAWSASRLATDDWKNQVVYPEDPLRSPDPGHGRQDPRWIKFAIVLEEPHRVFFQDSTRYRFHYDFATTRLDPFLQMTRAEFDAVSLHRNKQQVVLGAVLFAPPYRREWAVQIVGMDPYPVEQVADWIDLVRAVVLTPDHAPLHYFPTYEQDPIAQANLGFFQSRGIPVSSASRWAWNDECYSPGWALGRLVFVPAADLAAAYRDGRLRPDDLLLIDVVPAAIPPVAGIVTLSPATPNAHAVILAQSFGVPFVYFADGAVRDRLLTLDGREVMLRAKVEFSGAQLKIVDVEGQLDPHLRGVILELKTPPTLFIPPLTLSGHVSLPVDDLGPEHIVFVGGKAAHFGLLRRTIPDNCPSPAIAFTFDLWEDYLNQPLAGGTTLRSVIDDKLSVFSWPPDMAALQTALEEVRDLIRNGSDFSPETRILILNILLDAGFNLDRRIRFRSSTNVEDSEQFSGAGLYDSYSGCLGDDLFPYDDGPSFCNPDQPRKRGVFRALRRVYASFYNDNAFLERLRHGLDESQVGMAVLVHYSFPDEIELANGVATFEIQHAGLPNRRSVNARFVTQSGAVSVTNPDGNAVPEVVHAFAWAGGDPWLDLQQYSNLVPLGGTVLDWERDYRLLFELLDQSARAYEAAFPDTRRLTLNFEYKKVAPDGLLSVNQMRLLPDPPDPGGTIPWLLHETNRYAVFQGEYGELFANHRLKSFWSFQTANLRLDPDSLSETFYREIDAEFVLDLHRTNIAVDIQALPNFRHERDKDTFLDRWTWGNASDRRGFELQTWLPIDPRAGCSPIVFLSDSRIELAVHYAESQPAWDYSGPIRTWTDRVTLAPVDPIGPRSLLQTRQFSQRGISINTSFYWPPEPVGPIAGYTAPLQGWVQTTITGLTSRPIVLRDEYAQTYRPGHHNFWEEFLFDPHLDPGVDPDLIEELAARNIRGLAAGYSQDQPIQMWIWDLDNTLRQP